MSNRPIPVWGLVLLMVMLSGCASAAATADTAESALQQAVGAGIITLQNEAEADIESVYGLAEAEIKDMTWMYDVNVQLYVPTWRTLSFTQSEGWLKQMYVMQGDRVSKGDVLAEITYDQSALAMEREQLLIRQQQFEQQYTNEDAWRQNEIEQMKNAFTPDMNDIDREIQRLQLEKKELAYEQFLYRNGRTRADYAKQLADIDERLAGGQIIAPFDGIIQFVSSIRPGSLVRYGTRLITVIDDSVLQLEVQTNIDLIRYGDILDVSSSRLDAFEFKARVVSDPISTDTRQGQYTYQLEPVDRAAIYKMMEDRQISPEVLYGASFLVHTKSVDMSNVLVVPHSAVREEDADKKTFVMLYEDGMLKKRFVQTGVTLQGETQILDGLEAGQIVVINN